MGPRSSAVVVLVCALLAPGPRSVSTPAAAADSGSYAALVNPFIGTGAATPDLGAAPDGNTYPGAVRPFGMISWSPDTLPRNFGSGYGYAHSVIRGFSLTHMSGPGGRNSDDVPILPTVGPIGNNPGGITQPFSHDAERAEAGFYEVDLDPGPEAITSRVTVTDRAGIGQFDFPATDAANLLFKTGDSPFGSTTSQITITGDREVSGSVNVPNDGFAPGTITVYFAATFDRPFTEYGYWYGAGAWPALPAPANGVPVTFEPTVCPVIDEGSCTPGAWVTFDATDDQRVQMKVAISYVSEANAWDNLQAEIPHWDFEAVRRDAFADWDDLLSRIDVEGGSHDDQVQFYTAIYHSLISPSLFSDANGEYLGFDSAAAAGVDDRVHVLADGEQAQYSLFSGWDIYRSQFPLMAMIAPEETSAMVTSLLRDYEQGGWLPKYPFANKYTGIMSGDAADPMIAFAYGLGADDFDTDLALEAMVKGATVVQPTGVTPALTPWDPGTGGQGWYMQRPNLKPYLEKGYTPNVANDGIQMAGGLPANIGASLTMEYASADYAISRFAELIGRDDVAATFLERSANWTNVFNVDSCFVQPRDQLGQFPDRDPRTTGPLDDQYGQNGFQEGSNVQYTWMVSHDLHGLFEAMGGPGKVVTRLDDMFTHLNTGPNRPYYWAGNEPALQAPFAYNYAGAAYKTQEVVHRIMQETYANSPSGLPGNDDLGSMSSWYAWAAMGMYPVTPGAPMFVLSAPIFSRITLHQDQGDIVINAPGATPTSYVQGVRINGEPWTGSWLPSTLITHDTDTVIDVSLGSEPNTDWGRARADQPPSYPAGAMTFPPGKVPPSGSACDVEEFAFAPSPIADGSAPPEPPALPATGGARLLWLAGFALIAVAQLTRRRWTLDHQVTR